MKETVDTSEIEKRLKKSSVQVRRSVTSSRKQDFVEVKKVLEKAIKESEQKSVQVSLSSIFDAN